MKTLRLSAKSLIWISGTLVLVILSGAVAALQQGGPADDRGAVQADSDDDEGEIRKKDIGVLVYTHGIPSDPVSFKPDIQRITAIENHLEKELGLAAEKITHMPMIWDYGLSSLEESEVKYAIFLYTDMFGPDSTVIHDASRGAFGGIPGYPCPPWSPSFAALFSLESGPATIDSTNAPILASFFAQQHIDIVKLVERYGPPCYYMGNLHIPAASYSDIKLVFAEPNRPDHPITREIFVKQAMAVSNDPPTEILVLVGHGARADANNEAQIAELSCAASYVEKKLEFSGSTGLTVREDWPELVGPALDAAIATINDLLTETGAETVVLIPATGSGSGFNQLKARLDQESISYVEGPPPDPTGKQEYVEWAASTLKETVSFIQKQNPTESTITPYWDRTYPCD